jgi:glycosyltransferase involved in cell wall biosynthesis
VNAPSNPLVSVILPVRDGARFLSEAIESVLTQDFRPIELILVCDRRSTDGSLQIAQACTSARLAFQTEGGIADAWNLGIANAEGALLAFISSDDRWTPSKLTRQMAVMTAKPSLVYTIGFFRYFLEVGCSVPSGFNPRLLGRDLPGPIMETLLARAEVFQTVGRFDPHFTVGEDVDWFARARDQGVPTEVVPELLLEKRVHDRNLSINATAGNAMLMQALRRSLHRKRRV